MIDNIVLNFMHRKKLLFITPLLWGIVSCSSGGATKSASPVVNCTIAGLSESIETVYNYNLYHTNVSGGDYADNPVRPFLVKQGESYVVNWFASNSKGYCKSYGLPLSESVPDILAQIRRVVNPVTGDCETWVTSRFNSPTVSYLPSTYYNELWMVEPYTVDGINIMALIHNEYHIIPENVTNVYGNLIGASSYNSAESFQLYQSNESNNIPVIVAPYAYTDPSALGKGGMFAQSNIIKWGNYYYMLVNQVLNTIVPAGESAPTGVCLYRTADVYQFNSWRGWNAITNTYDIPLVESYPENLSNPQQYWCSSIPGLPDYFHYTWSYNVLLNKFIIVGLNENYNNSNNSAFVYTLANLDAATGVLTSADGSNNYQIGFLRFVNSIESWQKVESVAGQYYPSILDPNSPQLSNNSQNPLVESEDLNFQYSGLTAYLYYTYFHPHSESGNLNGQIRDIVRQKIIVQCK